MTERLYYHDCYLCEFDARVVEAAEGGRRVYLDRTAFYPASGNQLHDLGTLEGIAVVDVTDEGERVAHILDAPLTAAEATGRVDWPRRYDLMQQHTGQHLLSAVLAELYGWTTVSVHMGLETSTVDVSTPAVAAEQLERAELRCAQIIGEARPVHIGFEEASANLGLRKEPARTGTLRIVSLEGIDRSACGGTHVRSTAEIGCVRTGKVEKIRGISRIEFFCGQRALRRAHHEARALAAISRVLSMPAERCAETAASLVERNKALEKERMRLAVELARREGRDLFAAAVAGDDGLRRITQTGLIDDAMRARAQAFVAGGKAVFLAVCENPPSLLLAASADAGIHAGERMKAALAAAGGRGGGNAALAQGSVPEMAALRTALAALTDPKNQGA